MNYAQQLSNLETNICNHIVVAIQHNGVESSINNSKCIRITEPSLQFTLGHSYLVEINENNLVNKDGYEFGYVAIELEQLAHIADSLEIK